MVCPEGLQGRDVALLLFVEVLHLVEGVDLRAVGGRLEPERSKACRWTSLRARDVLDDLGARGDVRAEALGLAQQVVSELPGAHRYDVQAAILIIHGERLPQ